MSKKEAPCLGCKDRHNLCHATGEKYKAYRDALNERNTQIRKQRAEEARVRSFVIENTQKAKRLKNTSSHLSWRKNK